MQNIQGYTIVYKDTIVYKFMQKYTKQYTKICNSVQRYAIVYKDIQRYTKIYKHT